MNSRTTKFLLAAAAGLFLYIYFVERRGLDTDQQKARAARVLPQLKPDAITALEITTTNMLLRAEASTDGWRLMVPSPYAGQRTLIEGFLDSLANLTRVTQLTANDVRSLPKGYEGLGLEPAQVTIVVTQGGQRHELRLGSRTVVGGNLYARLVGQDSVLVADATILDRVPADVYAWRDRRLTGQRGSSADGFEVRRKGLAPMEITRDPATRKWRVLAPIQARADNAFVDQLLELLQTASVSRFLPDASAADLEGFGLQPPELELSLKKGTNELASIRFGRTLTNDLNTVYGQVADGRSVVAVDKGVVEVLRSPISQFRDHRLISIEGVEAQRFEVEAHETFAVERRTDGSWWVLARKPFRADMELLQAAFNRVASLTIVDFLSDAVADYTPFGLTAPSRRYRVFGPAQESAKTNAPVGEVWVGTNMVSDRIAVRRPDEGSVYAAKLEEVLRLPHSAFQLRDRKIVDFSVTNLVAVTAREKGKTMGLSRSQNGSWTLPAEYQGKLELNAILETAHKLGSMKAVAWVGQGQDALDRLGFATDGFEIRIEILKDAEPLTHWIRFGRKAPSGNRYAAISLDGEWIAFEFPAGLYSDVINYLNVSEAGK